MATILRGKRKGEEVKIIQYCNDWFYVEPNTILSPTSLKFTDEEAHEIREAALDGKTGTMFREYRLDPWTNTFSKIRRHR